MASGSTTKPNQNVTDICLIREQRYTVESMHRNGSEQNQIVEAIGWHPSAVARIVDQPQWKWNDAIKSLADEKKVTVLDPTGFVAYPVPIPPNVLARAKSATPPKRLNQGPPLRGPGRSPRPDFDPPRRRLPPSGFDEDEGLPPHEEHAPPDAPRRSDGGQGHVGLHAEEPSCIPHAGR